MADTREIEDYLNDPRKMLACLIVSDLPEKDQLANAEAAGKLADHLIDNGVTIPVHCKDCKHYMERTYWEIAFHECWFSGRIMDKDDFCSYGERKDNGSKQQG